MEPRSPNADQHGWDSERNSDLTPEHMPSGKNETEQKRGAMQDCRRRKAGDEGTSKEARQETERLHSTEEEGDFELDFSLTEDGSLADEEMGETETVMNRTEQIGERGKEAGRNHKYLEEHKAEKDMEHMEREDGTETWKPREGKVTKIHQKNEQDILVMTLNVRGLQEAQAHKIEAL